MSIRLVLLRRGGHGGKAAPRVLERAGLLWLSLTASALAQGAPTTGPGGSPAAGSPTAVPGSQASPAEAPRADNGAAPAREFAGILAQSGGLTAADVARRAADESVDAAIRREQVVIADESRERVFWEAAPRLTLTARTTRLSEVDAPSFAVPGMGDFNFPQPQTNHLLNAGLVVPLSDYLLRTVQAVRGAKANQAAAALEERAARVTSASNAKLSYYDWVRARLEGVSAEQALSQASAQLARTRALHEVGRAAEADLLQAVAFEADAQLAFSQSQTQETLTEERLRIAIDAAPGERLSIGEDVLAEFPAASEAKAIDDLYREALAQRLEIQALEKSQAALSNVRSVEASRALPRFEAFGNLTYANPNPRIFPQEPRWSATWDVGLQLVWAVNDLGTAGTQARTVRSQVAQLEHQQTGVERALRVEVVGAFGSLNQARLNVRTAGQGQRAADAAYAARQQLQEQGMGTTLELMQAETVRIRARLNVINAHIALRVARVQLDHALGRDVAPKPSQRPAESE